MRSKKAIITIINVAYVGGAGAVFKKMAASLGQPKSTVSLIRTARIREKLAVRKKFYIVSTFQVLDTHIVGLLLILQVLCCPYLEGLEDAVVHKLLLTPGEARLRLLEWLVARYPEQCTSTTYRHHL